MTHRAIYGWTAAALLGCSAGAGQSVQGLTAIPGVEVGHSTMAGRPTGCTVVLFDPRAVAGADIRGAAPGTRETDLLRPGNLVERIDALLLAGGSAFGLDAGTGVVRFLEERGRGYLTGAGRVPIVPGAIIYDLGVGDNPSVRPDAECGYRAAVAAGRGPVEEGSVGAGAGATVGKLLGFGRAMKSGVGSAAIELPGGLIVAALVVVNAVGDVIDPGTGAVVAGARTRDGLGLQDVRQLIRTGELRNEARAGANTTLGVVVTNANLTRAQVTRIATVAHDGFAQAIFPAHSPFDGDAIFAVATGSSDGAADMLTIGALAVQVMAEAVLRAVRETGGLEGLPSVRELQAGR